jgi:hypothetical protein
VDPALDAATAMAAGPLGFDIGLSAVREGQHTKNSFHYRGMAEDIATINGVPVGNNEQTISFLVANIIHNPYVKALGTIADLATNPQLQALAHKYGKELFTDIGTGPHVHFSVGNG